MHPVFRRILVATDLDASADAAVIRAHELARASHGTLGVVVAPPVLGRQMSRPDLETRLESHVRALAGRERHAYATFVVDGSPAEVILERAADFKADLVVVGRGVGQKGNLGRVARDIVNRSPASVLVVRDASPGPVLAAVDLGKSSTEVVRVAAGVAASYDAKLHVLHAIDFSNSQIMVALSAFFGGTTPPAADEDAIVSLARTALDADLAANGVRGEVAIAKGKATEVVLTKAQSLGASVLVVGATAHPLLTRLGLGSVAEAAVRLAPTSVLVVRQS
jgi:nucleotide-binding universal stress UspA family protein